MMVDVALKVTALLAAAWTVSFLLRGRAASIRHAVWIGLMAAALALPVLAALTPSIELAWLPAGAPEMRQPASVATPARSAPLVAGRSATTAAIRVASSSAAPRASTAGLVSVSLGQALAGAWLFVALLLVVRIAVAHAQARRLLSACADPPAALVAALAAVARELNVRVPPLRMAAAGTMPAVIGVLRPSVIVPADAMSWTAERLRLVLLHECAHVCRRDALLQVIASLATAVYWWHPLTWLAARRVVRERELACDDLVIATGTSGSDYASHLVDIARALKPSRQPAMAALAMARSSELEGRLIALLEERPRPSRSSRAFALGLGLALVALAVIAPLKLVARGSAPVLPAEQASASNAARGERPAGEPQPAGTLQSAAQAAPQVRASEQVDAAPAPQMDAAFTDALLRALDDEDSDNRMMAIMALSRTQRAEFVPMLTRMLEDGDRDVRAMALLNLIQMEREEARAFLPRALQDESEDIRAIGLIGLRKLDHPDRRALALRAAGDPSDDVRAMAALTLAGESGADVDAMLVKLSEDPSSDVRGAALIAMTTKSGDIDGLAAGFGIGEGVGIGVAQGIAQGVAQGVLQGVAQGVAGGLKVRDKQQ